MAKIHYKGSVFRTPRNIPQPSQVRTSQSSSVELSYYCTMHAHALGANIKVAVSWQKGAESLSIQFASQRDSVATAFDCLTRSNLSAQQNFERAVLLSSEHFCPISKLGQGPESSLHDRSREWGGNRKTMMPQFH